jgi:hypothetical protein
MTELCVFARELPTALATLPSEVARVMGLTGRTITDHSELAGAKGPLLVVLARPDATDLRALEDTIDSRSGPTALVVGDGWIGTDAGDLDAAIAGASAVALARSIAVRRHATGRVNVVCVPQSLLGVDGSQRGPLKLEIGTADVADVIAFALSDQSCYIDGQVLYANGGRQLFSSLTA